MGFNPMQPGRTRKSDVVMFLFGLALIAGALIYAFH